MLGPRLASAAVGLPLLFLAVWFGGLGFTLLVALAATVATWELLRLVAPTLNGWRLTLALIGAVALTVSPHLPGEPAWAYLAVIAAWAGAILLGRVSGQAPSAFALGVNALGAIFFIGILLSLYLALREGPQGSAWTFLALGVTFANDTAAYMVGRLLGRHRLAPAISPHKTIEGALGGLAAGVLACWVLAYTQDLPLGAPWTLALGAGTAAVGQGGDLLESYIKRRAGAKDASGLIPGHGGLLDRLDSLLLVAPLVYGAARLAAGP